MHVNPLVPPHFAFVVVFSVELGAAELVLVAVDVRTEEEDVVPLQVPKLD